MTVSDRVAARLLRALPPGTHAAAVRRGDTTVVATEPVETITASGGDGVRALDCMAPGFWVGFLAFELGHAIEPVRADGASREPAVVPDVMFARFDTYAAIDARGRVEVRAAGRSRKLLDEALALVRDDPLPCRRADPGAAGSPIEAEPEEWTSSLGRAAHAAAVEHVRELLAAGECYQVNLTRRLTLERALDPVGLYDALATDNPAPHLAFLRSRHDGGELAVVSASPERFLRRVGTRVETRPVKGTASSAGELRDSAKDRAENVMIVDLARNDLGRVCTPGSIEVPDLCAVEHHPGLHHLVSTVRGRLAPGVGFGELVAATFPPASVTGAPKPRVLQAIEDLEPVRRGVYCGAMGWIDTTCDEADLAVAIRTFTITRGTITRGTTTRGSDDAGRTHLGVGGGIVADSRPEAEWAETELKAHRLLRAARRAGARADALVAPA